MTEHKTRQDIRMNQSVFISLENYIFLNSIRQYLSRQISAQHNSILCYYYYSHEKSKKINRNFSILNCKTKAARRVA